MVRRALASAVLAVLLLPGSAAGHATLQGTEPGRGAALERAPERVVLEFDEPVEAAFGAVRVFDARGTEVASADPYRPAGDARRVAVDLPAGLAEGGYTVTFRVISADSHPVSGGFVFAYGEGAGPAASVDELLAGSAAGPVTVTALGAARALQYAAIALGAGTLIFLLACWRPAARALPNPAPDTAFARRARTLVLVAATAGAVSAAAAVVLQGAVASGSSAWEAAAPGVVGEVLGTRFGTVFGIAALLWVAVAAAALTAGPVWAGVPAAVLCAAPGMAGHASVQDPVWLLLTTTTLHVAAMAAWTGGIAALVLAVRRGTREIADPGERTRLLAAVVGRFSALATIAIAVILATGLAQSVVLVEAPGNLLETAFGRAVAIKAALFTIILGVGWFNRSRLLPALRRASGPGRAGVLLRRTLRADLALGIAVLAVTGALASYPPASAESAGPFATSEPLGPARLEVTVDPARVGPNEMHLYLFSRADGAPYDRAAEVTVRASLPEERIEPIEMDAEKAGPGHYVVTGGTFGVPGEWSVEIAARVGEFDLHTTTIDVPVD